MVVVVVLVVVVVVVMIPQVSVFIFPQRRQPEERDSSGWEEIYNASHPLTEAGRGMRRLFGGARRAT